jgi:SAM-dependent methyltransferase
MHSDVSGFNEEDYLAANPDVAAAVRSGACRSGAEHYALYGRKENRHLGRQAAVSADVRAGSQRNQNLALQVEKHWDSLVVNNALPPRSSWFLEHATIRHINRIVCGEPIDGLHAGFHKKLAQFAAHLPPSARAVSIGCGLGTKEMDALGLGIVQHFDCYDVSGAAIEGGRAEAQRRCLADRITFHQVDPFESGLNDSFDLVYWNNALHHMSNVVAAVRWSSAHLNPGGVFAMDDYVGATRFQHSPETLRWVNRILSILPDRLLQHWDGTRVIPKVRALVNPEDVARIDPSEAVDSGTIISAVTAIFPRIEIIKTGGIVYFIALDTALQNFASDEDMLTLNSLLLLDESLAHITETQYAVAFGRKY